MKNSTQKIIIFLVLNFLTFNLNAMERHIIKIKIPKKARMDSSVTSANSASLELNSTLTSLIQNEAFQQLPSNLKVGQVDLFARSKDTKIAPFATPNLYTIANYFQLFFQEMDFSQNWTMELRQEQFFMWETFFENGKVMDFCHPEKPNTYLSTMILEIPHEESKVEFLTTLIKYSNNHKLPINGLKNTDPSSHGNLFNFFLERNNHQMLKALLFNALKISKMQRTTVTQRPDVQNVFAKDENFKHHCFFMLME